MYHSVWLGDKNTWDDWGLVCKERPFIAPPTPKTNYIDIPGASTKLDFSDGLTGYPTFENRTGSIEFIITDQYNSNLEKVWTQKYTEIMTYVTGRRLKVILEDDPSFFYEGRVSVESYKPGSSASEPWSTITINYDLGPYKWTNALSTDDDWLWNPFSFVDGVILSSLVKDIPVTTSWQYKNFTERELGCAPFCPEFLVSLNTSGASLELQFIGYSTATTSSSVAKSVQSGTHTFYDMVFWGDVLNNMTDAMLRYKTTAGTGTFSLRYRRGGF